MTPLVKTSGGMGLHVVVPLEAGYTYDAAKMFAEIVAHRLAHEDAARITLDRHVSQRGQSAVYFDFLQVGRGKTFVAPYSVRARDGAPVSTPLAWDEVEALPASGPACPQTFLPPLTSHEPKRLERDGDHGGKAWKKHRLEPAISKAQKQWK